MTKVAADKMEGVLTEEVEPALVGPYGESKIAAEKYASSDTKIKAAMGVDRMPVDV